MYQSSTRNNFLDILTDPTAIAILASIAVHALIGSTLPFFTQPEKVGKKAGPTTVKVVELTPNELQRIPQVPQTPTPQVSPPVTQPVPPKTQSVAPRTTEFSTTPQSIPFSPIRTPFNGETIKPPVGSKTKITTPQKKSADPNFDPGNIFKSSPTPTKTTKISTQPPPTIKTPPNPKLKTATQTDDDGGDNPTTTPNNPTTPQPPPSEGTTKPPASSSDTPTIKPVTPPFDNPTGGSASPGIEQTAAAQERKYLEKYPGIKSYGVKELKQPYPQGSICPKTQQLVVVYMVAYDKVPENQNNDILGNITPDSLDNTAFVSEDTPENQKLILIAKDAAITAANSEDRNRPAEDKGKKVLYRYKVSFDPETCKK